MEWISTEIEEIPEESQVLCGCHIYNKTSNKYYWESYLITVNDEGDLIDEYGDCFTCWTIEDFTHWCNIPESPELPL